jgi:hypothetical protein
MKVKIEKLNEKLLNPELDLHGYDFHSKNIPSKIFSKFPYIKLTIKVLNKEEIVFRKSNF